MSSDTAVTVNDAAGRDPAYGPESRLVRTSDLRFGYSPRQVKLDDEHVLALMEVADQLPPVLVSSRTSNVIDGAHRLEAFRRLGRREIRAVMFNGPDNEAMALAVRANVTHGKPLNRMERQAAAATLLRQLPERSDRWLAGVCGLSHTTIARVRKALGVVNQAARKGRDGRERPVDPERGRQAVMDAINDKPSSSRRELAEAAGVSLSTAQRVAAGRRSHGEPPLQSWRSGGTWSWLQKTAVSAEDLERHLGNLPAGQVREVAEECRRREGAWAAIANALELSLGSVPPEDRGDDSLAER